MPTGSVVASVSWASMVIAMRIMHFNEWRAGRPTSPRFGVCECKQPPMRPLTPVYRMDRKAVQERDDWISAALKALSRTASLSTKTAASSSSIAANMRPHGFEKALAAFDDKSDESAGDDDDQTVKRARLTPVSAKLIGGSAARLLQAARDRIDGGDQPA